MGQDLGRERPLLSARLVAVLTLGLTAVLMAARFWGVEPAHRAIVPKGWAALPFALLLALGLAVLMGLVRANRHRWGTIWRQTRGRVIGALVLGFLTPVAVFDWFPWIAGGLSLSLGLGVLSGGGISGLAVLAFWPLASLLWYPAACLIVAGIHGHVMRVAVFALMFWAAYSAIILFVGTQQFQF